MPMKNPSHPGEIIRTLCLEPTGITVTDAAKALGVSRKHFSDLVNCKTGVSPEMAIRIAKVFGGSSRVWYMAQASYDLAQATEKVDDIVVSPLLQPNNAGEQAAA